MLGVGKTSILEAVDHVKNAQNEMVDGSKSEGGSVRRGTGSRRIGTLEINSFHLISAVGIVSCSKPVLSPHVLYDMMDGMILILGLSQSVLVQHKVR